MAINLDLLTDMDRDYSRVTKQTTMEEKYKMINPGDLNRYMRIGTDYYRMSESVSIYGMNRARPEETLDPWNKQQIIDDHGKEALANIMHYDGFTNVPSHTNFQQVINNQWNLYYNVDIETQTGEWKTIEILLRHLFEEQYEMALDYIETLYLKPTQKLPITILMSQEQGTGKSTFLFLLKLIFKQNMAIVSSADLTGDFNSHWISKLIVACEGGLIDKKDVYEKLKSISTARYCMRSQKGKTAASIPCAIHSILTFNHEEEAIKIDETDSRLWIRKIKPIAQRIENFDQKLEQEVPAFLHYIKSRLLKF